MSVPLYSCTREARFVSVSTPHILEAHFNTSIYGRALQPLRILEARL